MATSSVADNKPEEEAARWTLNGGAITIVFDSVTMNAAFDGEKLTLFSDDPGSGGYMVFTREEPKPIALPAAVEAAGEADFLGSWTASVIALDGVAVDIGLLGSTPVLTLDVTPGQVVMTSVWMGNEPRSIVCTSVFEDGALTLTDDTGLVTHLFLGEDGGLQATSEEGGPVQTIYYVAAEGATLAPAA